DLTPLEAVPRVVGVLVVRAEHDVGQLLGVEPVAARRGGHPVERRVDEHPSEVEHHCLHRHVPPPVGISPVSNSSSNSAAPTIGTPSASALVTLDAPGSSPTTTAKVFLDTLPGDL